MHIVKVSLTTKVIGIGRGCILQRQQGNGNTSHFKFYFYWDFFRCHICWVNFLYIYVYIHMEFLCEIGRMKIIRNEK